MKKTSVRNIIIIVLGIGLAFGSFMLGRMTQRASLESHHNLGKVRTTLDLIDRFYVDSIRSDSLIDGVIPMLLSQLDPHSYYYDPQQGQSEREMLEGHFFGIGITFNTLIDTIVVVSTIPNGPSDLVGVKAGDRIISVDGQDVAGRKISNDSIMKLLKGPKDSMVKLGIYRPKINESTSVTIRRGEVPVRQIDAAFMLNDSLGCISLSHFTLNTHRDFTQAYATLKKQGMKGLVLDLRDNPGGLMHTAIALTNEFLDTGNLIIYTEGRAEPRKDIYSDGTGNLKQIPLYVLINENSASSSEIVSGALQDNDRAVIIGRRSFGKGLVQKLFEFKDGSAIHLTIARYYTPSGRSIQRDYKLGAGAAYSGDLYERYVNGEMFHLDSIHMKKDLLYHTTGGREVYGGGGIIPDIFMARDTVGYTSYYGNVVQKGVLQKFAFIYADKHRELLMKLGDGESCHKFLQNQGLAWQMARYASTQGIRMQNYLVYVSQELIERALCTLIVANIFGQDDSAKVSAQYDNEIKMAMDLFAQGVYSPLNIPSEVVEKSKEAQQRKQVAALPNFSEIPAEEIDEPDNNDNNPINEEHE